MDRSNRSTNKTLAILSMSLLLATSVKAMQRRNREISSKRVQSDYSPWRTASKMPAQNFLPSDSSHSSSESLEGVVISGLSRLKIDNSKIDTRPRTSSRFFFRKPNGKAVIDADEDIDTFSMKTGRGQTFASTSTGGRVRRYSRDADEDGEFSMEIGRGQTFPSSSGRVRRHPRDILNLPRLDVRRVADISSEENTILSRTESNVRSAEQEFKKAYGSDGSWEYARRLRKEKRLDGFCTSVQRINGDGFSMVKDAHLTSALLNLGSKTINAEMIRFTTAKKPRYTYFITKGLRADCVFTLRLKSPRAVVYFLGKHLCNIEGPTPVRPSLKKRTLQHSTTHQVLFSRLGKLFGLLNINKSSKE